MDHGASGCFPTEKFPTCAFGCQGRGPVKLLSPNSEVRKLLTDPFQDVAALKQCDNGVMIDVTEAKSNYNP
jgi:hypothetical protein